MYQVLNIRYFTVLLFTSHIKDQSHAHSLLHRSKYSGYLKSDFYFVMCRIIIIALLVIFVNVVVNAQQDTIATVSIDEVVVSGNRIRLPLAKTPGLITVLGKEEIASAPVSSVGELLVYCAGVDIRQRGPNGVQADVGIHGSSFDQVLILVNGIRVSDPQTGHHSLNLPVDPGAIEQIEIYKGSAARVFGQNAFAGAINIVTKVPDGHYVRFSARAGDFSLYESKLAAKLGGGYVSAFLSGEHTRSAGYKYNTDFGITNIFFQSEIMTGAGSIGVTGGISDRSFGANGFYASPDSRDQFESVRTSMAAAEFSPRFDNAAIKGSIRVYWRNNSDEYIFIRSDPDYYRNDHTTNCTGLDMNLTLTSGLGITGVGVDLGADFISSNRLGERKRLWGTLFAEQRILLGAGKLIVTPGIQANMFDRFRGNILPGIDLGFYMSPGLMLYGSTGYTFRIPTYTDLYYEDPVNSSNPDLQPERSFSGEFGFRTTSTKIFQVHGDCFFRNGKDLIDRIKENAEDKWVPENISKMCTDGFEAGMALKPSHTGNSSELIEKIEAGYTYTVSTIENSSVPYSKFELENIRNQVNASLTLKYTRHLSHTIRFRYVDRVNIDDYSVTDSRISWQNSRIDVFAEATNILSTRYRDANLVTMPGRWFSGGFILKL